jgi:hypothetical protein
MTEEVRSIVEQTMRADDETTAEELREVLHDKGHKLSVSTALHCRSALGWSVRGSAYCQMIREVNKEKRLDWAKEHLHEASMNTSPEMMYS